MLMVSLASLAAELGGRLVGDGLVQVNRLAPLETADQRALSFVSHARYASLIATTNAAALIVSPALEAAASHRGPCIVTDDPYLYFAHLTQWWRAQQRKSQATGIDPSAHVHPTAQLGQGVDIGPFAVVRAGAEVGDGVVLGAHSVVGLNARIGAHSRLAPHVSVGDDCRLGERCVLHGGVVIGADGFGFAPHQGQWIKIEQLGAVRIGNDVEIGANTCIDRGALDDTVIEDGVKLDNLIQIGHNVHIGAHTAIAGCAGVAGSATIGAHCTVGGGAVVLGHLKLADRVNISAASVVTRSITQPGHYSGIFPIDDNASWEKNAASLKQLNRLRQRLAALERSLSTNQSTPSES
jgi:UDP-3-O-[3-hydroxymyristoyl] glucosamine N-acyltransferase